MDRFQRTSVTTLRTGVAVASKQAAYRSAQADGTVGAGDSSKQAADTVDRFCEEETPFEIIFQILGLCSACGAVPVFVSPNRLHEL
jgi:hypothetical protein